MIGIETAFFYTTFWFLVKIITSFSARVKLVKYKNIIFLTLNYLIFFSPFIKTLFKSPIVISYC